MAPTALVPLYSTPRPNAPITLSDGAMSIREGAVSIRGRGRVSFLFTPDSHVGFRMRGRLPPALWAMADDTEVALGRGGAVAGALTTTISPDGTGTTYEGRVRDGLVFGDGSSLVRALVHVFNGPPYYGSTVTRRPGSFAADRLTLAGGGWAVTMDAVEDSRRLIDLMRRSGGHALTHVAEFVREDGTSFDAVQLREAVEVLGHALTFARCARTYPCLTVAYDAAGHRWEEWADRRLDPWAGRLSWFDGTHPELLTSAFTGLWRLWGDPVDRSVLKVALGFATEANGDISPESRLMLAQAALELLAWHRRRLSNRKFQALDKTDQLGHLLDVSRVNTSLPAAASLLGASALIGRPADGPAAVTAVRNRVAHSPRSTRHALLPSDVLVTGWRLSLTYVHLALLRWLDCEGAVLSALDLSSTRLDSGVLSL